MLSPSLLIFCLPVLGFIGISDQTNDAVQTAIAGRGEAPMLALLILVSASENEEHETNEQRLHLRDYRKRVRTDH